MASYSTLDSVRQYNNPGTDRLGPGLPAQNNIPAAGARLRDWLPQGFISGLAMATLLNWYPIVQGIGIAESVLKSDDEKQISAATNQVGDPTCITSTTWSGKLVLHKGAEIHSIDGASNLAGSDILGTVPEQSVYDWRLCQRTDAAGNILFGVDLATLNSSIKVDIDSDHDHVGWIEKNQSMLVQTAVVEPLS